MSYRTVKLVFRQHGISLDTETATLETGSRDVFIVRLQLVGGWAAGSVTSFTGFLYHLSGAFSRGRIVVFYPSSWVACYPKECHILKPGTFILQLQNEMLTDISAMF